MRPTTLDAGSIRLRPFRGSDIDWLYRVSLDPGLRRYIDLPSPYRRSDAADFVERVTVEGWANGTRAEFLTEDAATGCRLGRVGLHLRDDRTAEIGYWAAPEARARGVTSGAVAAVCRWAFAEAGIDLIEWRAEVGNHASRRVAEKVGFHIEGVLRQRLRHGTERADAWVGSLLPAEVTAPAPSRGSWPETASAQPWPAWCGETASSDATGRTTAADDGPS
ncbi:GNAT family protein [Streptomyces sp. DSM 44915]|uniref:GNAT family protein n=1 Tax=Streptomyces chisholmiae TaxID=3075540 RepID=A0ABU2K191_9ACTN|nr:GNAT family protein [Streptomyces sp. DSM 44915]MDT0270529.1 GNAT family protein [Streptomyces sp. DSM 44915]